MVSPPLELHEAEALFIEFEKFDNSTKSKYIDKFIKAYHLLRRYQVTNPGTPHTETCVRLRVIYTRSFLKVCQDVEVDLNNWMRVCYLLTNLAEIRPFLEADSSLQRAYDEFVSRYVDERLVSEFVEDEQNGKFKNDTQLSALFKMWKMRREMRTVC